METAITNGKETVINYRSHKEKKMLVITYQVITRKCVRIMETIIRDQGS